MWPLLTPGRNSGSEPSKRPAGRVSTTCSRPLRQIGQHVGEVAHGARVQSWAVYRPRRGQTHAGLERPTFRLSTCTSPPSSRLTRSCPNTRKVHQTRGALKFTPDPSYTTIVSPSLESQSAHSLREPLGRRQHVRQRRRVVARGVEIEEDGPGNVTGGKLRGGVAAAGRQVPRGVHHPQIGPAQVRAEPGRGDERRIVVGHAQFYSAVRVAWRGSFPSKLCWPRCRPRCRCRSRASLRCAITAPATRSGS